MNQYYTGIGSREKNAPKWAMRIAKILGYHFALKDMVLRSGGADGMDMSFEKGCDDANGKKEIYLPWEKFNDNESPLFISSAKAWELAQTFHPSWNSLNIATKKLHARNMHQVLGQDLNTPSKFILCYTNPNKGGTTQALRLAESRNIKIINLWYYDSSLWDTVTNEGLEEIMQSVVKETMTKRYKLQAKISNDFYKKWWYHPESECYIYSSINELRKIANSEIDLLEDVDDQISTRVVCVKTSSFDIYVGRGTIFGNPYKIGKDGDREKCIRKFYSYAMQSEKIQNGLHLLYNKKIGCHCEENEKCHGDILAEMVVNKFYKRS